MLHVLYLLDQNEYLQPSDFATLDRLLSFCKFKTTIVHNLQTQYASLIIQEASNIDYPDYDLVNMNNLVHYMLCSSDNIDGYLLVGSKAHFTGIVYRLLSTSKQLKSQLFVPNVDGTKHNDLLNNYLLANNCNSLIAKIICNDILEFGATGNKHLLNNLLSWLLAQNKCDVIDLDEVHKNNGKCIGGGSHASSGIVKLFKKSARGLGYAKLCDEINYLTNLPGPISTLR